jgi:hypothetical protein
MKSPALVTDLVVFTVAMSMVSSRKCGHGVNGFTMFPSTRVKTLKGLATTTATTFLISKKDLDDGDEEHGIVEEFVSASVAPKSRMNDFVAQFLDKYAPDQDVSLPPNEDTMEGSKLEDITDATHMIAIPMEQAHELLLELESVQRAILHHCPILLDACIPHAATRLPLLYIQATDENPLRVTAALGRLVTRLVKKHIFKRVATVDQEGKDRLNAQGYRPVTMTFQSLEIEGDNNSILSTVGVLENDTETDESVPHSITSANRFDSFMQDLQSAVALQGWKMTLPPDPNGDQTVGFRPRVSFMELPLTFDAKISHYKSKDTELTDEDMQFLTSKEGGNGISPIFWCQWWNDVFAKNVRLREIGIYPHSQVAATELVGLTLTSQFYLPYETISLPDGSSSMLRQEKRFQDYQEERMAKEQEKMNRLNEEKDSMDSQPSTRMEFSNSSTDPDIIMTKTRNRLERIYLESSETLGDLWEEENTRDASESDFINDVRDDDDDSIIDDEVDLKAPNHPIQPQDDDYIESWMEDRIKKAVNSLESVKSRNQVKKAAPPPVKDNPIFKAYKDGTLVPEDQKPKKKAKELGPYPGNDHFVGVWKFVSSPTGFEIEDGREDASENLILRVDGTTAGGPTLDLENKHKAAGGTWKMLLQENGDVLLRIRLVIPPEKSRIMVMEGRVQRMGPQSDIPTASRTFGIPEVEERAMKAAEKQRNLMSCSGQVHIEDAVTKKNEQRIGDFSLMKLHGPKDRSEYTITIPRPVRNID